MYKQYMNDYEKRAEQIRKAARNIETGQAGDNSLCVEPGRNETSNPKHKSSVPSWNLKTDDLLLLGLIFLLLTGEEKDLTLILALGYIFLTGL